MEERLQQQNDEVPPITTWDRAKYFASAAATIGGTTGLLGGGGMSLVFGAGAGALAAYLSPEIRSFLIDHMPAPGGVNTRRSKLSWLLTGQMEQEQRESNPEPLNEPKKTIEPLQSQSPRYDFSAEDELSAPMRKPQGVMLFSETLKSFTPSLDKIYIGTLATGEMVFCKAEDLCHVALAGSTRGGKSSIMRMLLVQLCYAGASVLVLNPHHSKYILDKKEDWTPFDPYLMHDPMECRKYEVIEHYLRQVATVLLPKRLDRFAVGQPVGKPYFLALDELPDIVKHIPDASSYLDDILRQGAKVGIFLIVAAQDFLVKTLKLEGGAVRECYRTALYVGGDTTTAKTLLDLPARPANQQTPQLDESELGRGTIMLRNWQVCKRSALAYVPLVDNQALYQLLGPSTYQPTIQRSSSEEEDDLGLGEMSLQRAPQGAPEPRTATQKPTRRRIAASSYEANQRRKAQETAIRREWHSIRKESPASEPRQAQAKQDELTPIASEREISLQEAFRLWSSGSDSVRDLAKALDITPYQANKLYTAMVEARMIEPKRKVVVRD